MDPVSLCASILAIVAGAQTGIRGLRKIKQYWSAPRQIDQLTIEIESLQSLLRNVFAFIEASNSRFYSEDLSQPVERADSVIQSFADLLSSPLFRIVNLSNTSGARLTWLRHKNDILDLFERLKLVKADLSVRFALCNANSSTRAEQSLSISIGIQERISQQLSIIIDRGLNADGISTKRCIVPVNNGMVDVDNDSASLDNERQTRSFNHQSALVGQLPLPGHNAHFRIDSSQQLSKQSALRCAPWCACKCHVKHSFRSPWALEMAFGRIIVQYTGQRPDCNAKKCHRSSPTPLSIIYQLPQYLLKRYVTMTMHYTPVDGPKFTLRAPRITPWSHRLWHYATVGDLTAVQRMFSEGQASPYDIDPEGSNALEYSAFQRDHEFHRFLIDQGVDPNLPNDRGRTSGELLWDNSFANFHDDRGIVGCMLKGADCTRARLFSNLHKIVLEVSGTSLQAELESSTACIDLDDAHNRTPLWWATIRDDLDSVETLLSFGANPNITSSEGESPLHFASSAAVCRALLSAGASVALRIFDYQQTTLHSVCSYSGSVEVVNLLVDAGISIEQRDTYEETPLLSAIRWGQTAAALRLVESGANVNVVNVSRFSSMHLAVIYSCCQVIPLLLAKGADYKATTTEGRDIAHLAAQNAYPETIKALAESNLEGLGVLQNDNEGKTPADYHAEREMFGDNEAGIQEAFEEFIKSVTPPRE